ncbi:MAG: FlgO family outer membrane protein [Bryobacteraceae bacterium]|jgi:TolB-like protein
MRFVLALLMIGACAFAQDAGIPGLAAKLGHQLASRQLKKVAVLQFTNKQNYDAHLSAHLVEQINREIVAQVPGIVVAGQEQSDAVLRQMRLVDAPEINTKDLETIATQLNVDAIVTGTFDASGQTVAIDATIFDGKSSYIIGAASAKLDRAALDAFLVERKGPSAPMIAIPSGMQIDVKMNEKVDAAEARNGKTVSAALENDLVVTNVLLAKRGTEVKLQATSPDGMELHLALASMTLADQRDVVLRSDQIIKQSTMVRPKSAKEGNGGTSADTPNNAPAQPKPGEAPNNAQFAFHLNQDAR